MTVHHTLISPNSLKFPMCGSYSPLRRDRLEVMKMHIINKRLVKEQVDRIKGGHSAYVETAEMANMVKKEIQVLSLEFYEDVTDIGSWFIPIKS
jgi:hypothetical protein